MSNQSRPRLEPLSQLETASRAAIRTLEKLMRPGTRYVLVVSEPDNEEAAVFANVDTPEIRTVIEELGDIYDVEVDQ